jgi:hypothetical protein
VLAQQVPAAVVSCKEQLAAGQHGVGACVSGFAHMQRTEATTGSGTPKPALTASPEASASNHGNAVSEVARSAAAGEQHGGVVSAVARSNNQAPPSASGSAASFGQSVAAVAHSTATSGEAHGEAVSSFARSNNPAAGSHAQSPAASARRSTPPSATPSPSHPANSRNTPAGGRGASGR